MPIAPLTHDHFNTILTYLPVVCIGVAILPLSLGLLWHKRRILISGLATIGIVAVAAPLLLHSLERDEHHQVAPHNDDGDIQTGGTRDRDRVAADTAARLHHLEEAAEAAAMRDATVLTLAFAGLIAVVLALSSALADVPSDPPPPAAALDDDASD